MLAVDHLHKHGLSRVSFDPANLIYYRAASRYQLALPDVGFRWQLGPVTPPWLSTRTEFERLWHPSTPYAVNLASVDARAELVAAARMFAWVMTGEIPLSIPPPLHSHGNEPESYAFWHDKAGDRRFIWEVLYRILGKFPPGAEGQISSAGKLRTEIRRSGGLSSYFVALRPKPDGVGCYQRIRGCLRTVLVLLLLGLAGYSLYYYIENRPPPLRPSPLWRIAAPILRCIQYCANWSRWWRNSGRCTTTSTSPWNSPVHG